MTKDPNNIELAARLGHIQASNNEKPGIFLKSLIGGSFLIKSARKRPKVMSSPAALVLIKANNNKMPKI